MKIKSLVFFSLMLAINVQAAEDGDVTKICLDGDDIHPSTFLSKFDMRHFFPGNDMDKNCELILLKNIGPIYPESAYTPGTEGWAKVSFTVTEEGLVVDARILDARPLGVFDQSAIRAAELFRFEPRIVNGQAVVVENVRHVFEYAL